MKIDDYNLEYFKFIRDEITKRVQIHFKLVPIKFAIVGALFAFLWDSKPQTKLISPFLVASIFSFLFDVIILENLGWIRSAGAYLKQNIEREDLPMICWENHFAQAEIEKKWSFSIWPWRCFSPCSYLLGVWGVGVLFWLGHIVFSFDATNRVEIFSFIIASYLLPYTALSVLRNLAGKVPMPSKKQKTELWSKRKSNAEQGHSR